MDFVQSGENGAVQRSRALIPGEVFGVCEQGHDPPERRGLLDVMQAAHGTALTASCREVSSGFGCIHEAESPKSLETAEWRGMTPYRPPTPAPSAALAVPMALFAGLARPHRLLGTSALSRGHVARVELKIRMRPAGKLQLDPKKTPAWVVFQAQKWPLSGCQGWCWGSNLTLARRRAGEVPPNHLTP